MVLRRQYLCFFTIFLVLTAISSVAADAGSVAQERLTSFLGNGLVIGNSSSATTTLNEDIDSNGNLYEANIGFQIVGTPITNIDYHDGPTGEIENSELLNAQKKNLKEFLKTHEVQFVQSNVDSGNNLQYTSSSTTTTSNSTSNSSTSITYSDMDEIITPELVGKVWADAHDAAINATEFLDDLPETYETNTEVTAIDAETTETTSNTTATAFIQNHMDEEDSRGFLGSIFIEESSSEGHVFQNSQKLSSDRMFSFNKALELFSAAFVTMKQTTLNSTALTESTDPNVVKTIVYEGNASAYMDNDNYEVVSESTVVVDSNTEEVTLVVRAKMKALNSLPSVTFMICMGIFVLLAIEFKNWVYKFFQEDLLGGLNSILRDNIVLMFVAMTLKILDHYYQISLLDLYVHVTGLSLGLLLFAFLWAVLGVFMAIMTNVYIKDWKVHENNFPQRERIFREFEDLYLEANRTRKQQKEFNQKKKELEYFLIRQEFISPTFLPVVGEDFLRDDFDFAYYLGGCMTKASSESFRYAVSTLWAVFFSMAIYTLAYYFAANSTGLWIIFIPLVVLLVMIGLESKLSYIYSQIVNVVYSPYDVNFTKFESLRQPLINLGRINLPRYLQGEAPPPSQFKRWIRSLTMPNRHELLFWFGSPKFVVRFIHFVLVGQMVWMVWFWLQEYQNIKGWFLIAASVIAWILTIVNLFLFTPRILRSYCVVSSIQMLKDRQMIRQVNDKAMAERSHLMMSLFRFIKAANRAAQKEAGVEDPANASKLREYMIKLVSENFQLLNNGDPTAQKITLAQLNKFAKLCGRTLSQEELMYLAHGVVRGGTNDIHFADTMEHIKRVLGDVGNDPARASRDVLRDLLKKDKTTSIIDLKKLLTTTEMLEDELVEKIMREIRYLPLKNAEISIELVGTLVRDSIQEFPR